jgi:hypothetical protein
VRDRLPKRPLAGEFLIGVQAIVIASQFGKLLNVSKLDHSRGALPSIADAQLFERQTACIGDHRKNQAFQNRP